MVDAHLPPEDPVQVGQVLDGRYRIEAIIGTGGMGRVYRAEHTGLCRAVAIKVLHADLGRNREAVTRFQREALASGRLDHQNIVGVSDFGVLDGIGCFLVMEALDGEPLGTRIDRDKRVPWREALVILKGVLSGLHHAHDRGVVHRDIKPDNIFLAKKDGVDVIKILDFGIAKLYAGTVDDPATTRAGITVGTPAYLSPEQAVGGDITPASDLYSTTCVLFEMLAGKTPFDGRDPLAMLTSHVSRQPPTLSEAAPDLALPPGLEAMVAKGLAKPIRDRFESAAEYLAAVQAILDGGAAKGSQPAVTVPTFDTLTPATVDPDATVSLAPKPAAATPSPMRVASLSDFGDPVPKKWVILGLVALAVTALAGITVAITSGHAADQAAPGSDPVGSAGSGSAGSGSAAKRAQPKDAPVEAPQTAQTAHTIAPPTEPPPPPAGSDDDDEDVRYQKLVKQLHHGATCEERRGAIEKLVELGDPRAIDELKRARHDIHERYMGLKHEDWNYCLTKDADAAVKTMTDPPPPLPPATK
nr:protein kinase [Kofleriaceae bacterium]